MSSLRFAVAVMMILSMRTPRTFADVFQIKVVDSQIGRGVPLVELQPTGGPKLITDSNGIVLGHFSASTNCTFGLPVSVS